MGLGTMVMVMVQQGAVGSSLDVAAAWYCLVECIDVVLRASAG